MCSILFTTKYLANSLHLLANSRSSTTYEYFLRLGRDVQFKSYDPKWSDCSLDDSYNSRKKVEATIR